MTPKTTKDAITSQTGTILTSANYLAFGDIASQEQAEQGAATNVWMSPQRTAQAIAALAPSVFVGDVTIEGSESNPTPAD
jgi:hypothetical protein